MKQLIFILFSGISSLFLPNQELNLVGTWQNEAGNRTVEFYQSGPYLEGKILGDNNANLVGKVVFTELKFNGKTYEGRGYLPKRNQYILCSLKLMSANTLSITGKVGVMSDTKIWKRLK
jgi:uncharacterized protein (DUF2147 family)